MSPPEAEMGAVAVTAPPTPGTPGGPLITGMRVDSMSFDHRKPIPPCKCLPVMGNPWGQHDTCFTDFPSPGVSLTRKVRDLFFFCFKENMYPNILFQKKKKKNILFKLFKNFEII